jgi:hypothetical protein
MSPIETRIPSAHAEFPSFSRGGHSKAAVANARISAERLGGFRESRLLKHKTSKAAEMFNRHRGPASLRPITSPAFQATPGINQGLYRIDHHSRWARRGRVYLELA